MSALQKKWRIPPLLWGWDSPATAAPLKIYFNAPIVIVTTGTTVALLLYDTQNRSES